MGKHGKVVNRNSGVEIPGVLHNSAPTTITFMIDGSETVNIFETHSGWEWVPDSEPFKDGDVVATMFNYSYLRMYGRWFKVYIVSDMSDKEAEECLGIDHYYRTTAAEYFGGNQS